jgi:hypothetical protein
MCDELSDVTNLAELAKAGKMERQVVTYRDIS